MPTMGALHDGHLSLVRTARSACDLVVCSIFVNPTQFNNADDLKNYPVTIENDIQLLIKEQCDVLYLPEKDDMYPADEAIESYALGYLEETLEGSFRPGHFQGVCQAVDRLLQRTTPDILYLGRKDYQQCLVIKKLLELTKRDDVTVSPQETRREPSGLAMSSRNLRLSAAELDKAPLLHHALQQVKTRFTFAKKDELIADAWQQLEQAGFRVEYLELANAQTLKPATDESEPSVLLVAAWLGNIRLIDNLELSRVW